MHPFNEQIRYFSSQNQEKNFITILYINKHSIMSTSISIHMNFIYKKTKQHNKKAVKGSLTQSPYFLFFLKPENGRGGMLCSLPKKFVGSTLVFT